MMIDSFNATAIVKDGIVNAAAVANQAAQRIGVGVGAVYAGIVADVEYAKQNPGTTFTTLFICCLVGALMCWTVLLRRRVAESALKPEEAPPALTAIQRQLANRELKDLSHHLQEKTKTLVNLLEKREECIKEMKKLEPIVEDYARLKNFLHENQQQLSQLIDELKPLPEQLGQKAQDEADRQVDISVEALSVDPVEHLDKEAKQIIEALELREQEKPSTLVEQRAAAGVGAI